MSNTDESRAAARAALTAYTARDGFDIDDDETSILDLVADLAHLADSMGFSGQYVMLKAADHYIEEADDEEDEDDEEEAHDLIDFDEGSSEWVLYEITTGERAEKGRAPGTPEGYEELTGEVC